MLVITGATGHIGSQATERLLEKGEQVRVIGRNAKSLKRFIDRGAEAAVGDLGDRVFLAGAFSGARAVFAMIPPNYTAEDFRAYQNRLGKSIAGALVDAGVSQVVNLSSQGAELAEGTGPILGLHDQETRLNALPDVNVVHLRPSYFMENLLLNIPLIQQHGIAGSAVRGDIPFAMIATRDIAAVVAQHLAAPVFTGKTVLDLLGPRDVSLDEATAVLGRAIGKPALRYVQFAEADALAGMLAMGLSADVARLFIEMSAALSSGRFGVGRPRTALSTTPTTIEAFAPLFAAAYHEATEPHAA